MPKQAGRQVGTARSGTSTSWKRQRESGCGEAVCRAVGERVAGLRVAGRRRHWSNFEVYAAPGWLRPDAPWLADPPRVPPAKVKRSNI